LWLHLDLVLAGPSEKCKLKSLHFSEGLVDAGAMVLKPEEVEEILKLLTRMRRLPTRDFDQAVKNFLQDPVKTVGNKNWIELLHKGAGLSCEALADKLKTTRQDINQTMQREGGGGITLKKMRAIAEVADCDFVYGFIPKNNESMAAKIVRRAAPFLDLQEVAHVRGVRNFTSAYVIRLLRFLVRSTGWGKVWAHERSLAKNYNWRINEFD